MNEYFMCSDDIFRLEVAEWAAGLAIDQATTSEQVERLRLFRILIRAEIDQFFEEGWETIVYWLEKSGFRWDEIGSE